MRIRKLDGFTLIELMITIAIIGILAGIAYPSYMNTVKKSNRSEGITELTDVAQRLQRCYTAFGRFDDPQCVVYNTLTGSTRMKSRGHQYYEITLATLPSGSNARTAFNLEANAVLAPQTKDKDGVNDCTKLNLNQRGQKTPTACW